MLHHAQAVVVAGSWDLGPQAFEYPQKHFDFSANKQSLVRYATKWVRLHYIEFDYLFRSYVLNGTIGLRVGLL